MAIVRCKAGHYYDEQKFSACPHCGIFAGGVQGNPEDRQGGVSKRAEDEERTVALYGGSAQGGEDAKGQTVALGSMALPADDQKTIGLISDGSRNDYVTGWLVCISGQERGRDYRLYHGFNHVGRDADMSVSIAEDLTVSRRNHCAIVYDGKSNCFYLTPEAGNSVFLNGVRLDLPKTLRTGELLTIGTGTFEFIAFCREGRTWEKE